MSTYAQSSLCTYIQVHKEWPPLTIQSQTVYAQSSIQYVSIEICVSRRRTDIFTSSRQTWRTTSYVNIWILICTSSDRIVSSRCDHLCTVQFRNDRSFFDIYMLKHFSATGVLEIFCENWRGMFRRDNTGEIIRLYDMNTFIPQRKLEMLVFSYLREEQHRASHAPEVSLI